MNLQKLAESLGLPKESTEAVVFEALAKRDAEGRAAVESLSVLSAELPKHGFKLDGKVLVRVEPLKLDNQPGDDDEKKALRAKVREAEEREQIAALTSNKEFVTGLSKKLNLPPAMIGLAEEILGVRGELEAVCLSKDGKVTVSKTDGLPKKLKAFMEQLSCFKGLKLGGDSSVSPKTDEELAHAARVKLAEELAKRQQPEEAAASK